MNKTILYITIALIALTAVTAQVTETGEDLEVTLLQYEPVPAHPGDSLDVWVKIENVGGDVARNVQLQMSDNYPFSVSSERNLHTIGTLPGQNAYVAKFRMRVDSNAPAGTSTLRVRYSKGEGTVWKEEYLPIDIESRITALEIESVEMTPKNLVPGTEGQLKLTVRNTADSQIRDVNVKLDLENSEAPIVPVQSSTQLRIDSLAPGETKEFVFNVMAELDASSNAYTLPVDVSFKDDEGDEITYETLVGIVIKSPPELSVTVDSNDVYSDARTGTVTLKFVNKGLDEIKFLSFNLSEDDSYKLINPTDSFYVGNIRSDDYELQDLRIEAHNEDRVNLPMSIQYRDAANNVHTTQQTVTLQLVEESSVTEEESNTTTWVIVLMVVSGIALYFWRKRKK